MSYSVLMSVYYKERPEYLMSSMQSIYNQTVPADDFVLVCDGPLNSELDSVIGQMQSLFEDRLQIVRLKENGGLGNALNEGMKKCRFSLIARMDSDDISRPDRCEKQLKIFENNPNIDIVSGVIEEFADDPNQIIGRRVPPEYNKEIIQYARKRNPFNHPCVMYRKESVEAAGGYQDFYLLEDYFLWIRMILNHSQGYNIQEPLLWMRTGNGMYKRRSGWKYVLSQKRLFQYMRKQGLISARIYYRTVIIRAIGSLIPNAVRVFLYNRLLRK